MKITAIGLFAILLLAGQDGEKGNAIVLESNHVRYTISSEGKNLGFCDRKTGTDYLDHTKDSLCASIRLDNKVHPAESVSYDNGILVLRFAGTLVEAALKVETHDSYILISVASVSHGECAKISCCESAGQ